MQELKKDRRRDPKPGFGSQIPAASLPQQRGPGYVPLGNWLTVGYRFSLGPHFGGWIPQDDAIEIVENIAKM